MMGLEDTGAGRIVQWLELLQHKCEVLSLGLQEHTPVTPGLGGPKQKNSGFIGQAV